MSHCGWNCQLAVGDDHPIPHPLAVILDHLMGHDAAGRRASGSRNTIPFFSSDKRRVIAGLGPANNVRFGSLADIEVSLLPFLGSAIKNASAAGCRYFVSG
jgi:hypothetical protein